MLPRKAPSIKRKLLQCAVASFACCLTAGAYAQGFSLKRGLTEEQMAPTIIFDIHQYSTASIYPKRHWQIDEGMPVRLNSTTPVLIDGVVVRDDYIEYSIIGYDNNNQPIKITRDQLGLFSLGKGLDFDLFNINRSSHKVAFEFLLDDSGSMHGQQIRSLENAVSTFFKLLKHDSALCNVTWFSSTHEAVIDSYPVCNSIGPITTRGEYGGTNISPGLTEVTQRLDQLDDTHQKVVIIITDGALGIDASELSRLKKAIGDKKVFVYSTVPQISDSAKALSDYVIAEMTDFEDYLSQFLSSLMMKYSNMQFVRIKR